MTDFTIEQLLKAINNSAGIITTISKNLGCEWHTAKKYIEKYPETKQALSDEIEKNIDKAEAVIQEAMDNKDIQTAKWYLQTIGKKRGYTEKQEIEHSGTVEVIKVKLPDDLKHESD